ncbi:MAG: hypothetical protein ACLPYS_13230 [Vulcanimicrobiaceae bacterium]
MRFSTMVLQTALVASTAAAASAGDASDYVNGPWHYRAVSCVDTTVTSVTPRLTSEGRTTFTTADFQSSGVDVSFATGLGIQPLDPQGHAEVVHYQNTAGNEVMMREHRGDRVQVCFLGGPAPTLECNPDKDLRGREYRVWDYKQQKQYSGGNSEHDCGGA